jgi:LemA protein
MDRIFANLIFVVVVNVIVFVILGLSFISNYNSLTRLGEILREAWGHIDAQLQRRYDALLSMSQVVQGYAGHEQSIDAVVAKARTLMGTTNFGNRVSTSSEAEGAVGAFMGHVVNIATSFPNLKADGHFQELLCVIQETGREITTRRESYNNCVQQYNGFLKKFPTRLYAMYLGFDEAKYFSFGGAVRADVPDMVFSQEAIVTGAIAGSPQFHPENPAAAFPKSVPVPRLPHENPPPAADASIES